MELLTSQERKSDTMCLLMKAYATTLVWPKGSNLKLIKALEPVASLQEIERAEKLAELHCERAIEDIQKEETLQFKSPVVSHRCTERRSG